MLAPPPAAPTQTQPLVISNGPPVPVQIHSSGHVLHLGAPGHQLVSVAGVPQQQSLLQVHPHPQQHQHSLVGPPAGQLVVPLSQPGPLGPMVRMAQ
jgi:hypothetical protein